MISDERASLEKRRRAFRFKFYLSAGAAGLILIFIFSAVARSPFFQIKEILISGVDDVKKPAILSRLISVKQSSKLARYLGYGNILLWRAGTIDADISFIEEGKIAVDFTEKKIKVEVKEKDRFLIWCDASENCFWVGHDGSVIEEAPASEGRLVDLIKSEKSAFYSEEKILSATNFSHLIKILEILKNARLSAGEIVHALTGELSVKIVGGPEIYFNLDLDPIFTVSALGLLRARADFKNLTYIDFRIENKAYYK